MVERQVRSSGRVHCSLPEARDYDIEPHLRADQGSSAGVADATAAVVRTIQFTFGGGAAQADAAEPDSDDEDATMGKVPEDTAAEGCEALSALLQRCPQL